MSQLLSRLATFALVVVALASQAIAQVRPQLVKPHRTAVISFRELAAEEASRPREQEIEPPSPGRLPANRPIPPGARVTISEVPPPAETGPGLPDPTFSGFLAASDDDYFPPDTDGAIGPNHVVTAVNGTFNIENRNGSQISNISTVTFWSKLGISDIFDPRIMYDRASDRWITVAAASRNSPGSSMLVAASQTSDPTGKWNLYSFIADSNGVNWADFPNMGIDADHLVMTANLFTNAGNTFKGAKLLVFTKSDLYPVGATPTARTFLTSSFSFAPATNYDGGGGTFYLVEDNGSGSLRVSTFTGGLGSEVFNDGAQFVQTTARWQSAGANSNSGPQLGGNLLDLGDSRMSNCALRAGFLWCAQTAFLPATGSVTRAAAQWWQIDISNFTVAQFGRVDDPNSTFSYAYPSIAVNKNQDVVVGYSRFTASQFVGSDFAFRYANDAPNTLRADIQYKTGESNYLRNDGSGANRWGDFSTSMVDPVDDTTLWTIQEYAGSPVNKWSTYWAHVTPSNIPETFTISGTVKLANNTAVAGVTLTLSGSATGTTTSADDGTFSFSGLAAGGTYVVTPSLTGYTFNPATQSFGNVYINKTAAFTATPTFGVSGHVKLVGVGLNGVTILLTGPQGSSTTTDATGAYSFSNLPGGSTYTLMPSLAGYTFVPPTQSTGVLSSNQILDFAANSTTFAISGKVTALGVALSGVTMTLAGAKSATTTTDPSGNYSFAALASGSYSITPSRAGFVFTPGIQSNFFSSAATVNFTAIASATTYTISGNIKLSSVNLSGVTMTLTGSQSATATTNATGNYSFSGLPVGGSYTITPSKTGDAFAPLSQTFNNLGANQTLNFTAAAIFAISGQITVGTSGLAGVTVALSGSAVASAVTDATGNYAFNALVGGGNYTVTPSLAGYTFNPVNRAFAGLAANQTGNFAATPPAVTMSLSETTLNFGVVGSLITSPQSVTLTFSSGSGLSWTATSNKPNITVAPASSTGNATLLITAAAGVGGVVTVTAAGATNSPQQIQVNIATATTGNPFGSFDTPTNNTTGIAGAIAVTGWALDNIEVTSVGVWREPVPGEAVSSNGLVFIGNGTFVVGARPDVEAANPKAPFAFRAGWGYQLLTNFLPNSSGAGPSGNGTYKLHAIAVNKAGAQTDLGTKSITVNNAAAAKPFGTLDTPTQGGTASGTQFVNFAWALTPNPFYIPLDGSTLFVTVDGVTLGHPVYNNFRADIANAFPGYANSSGAVGYYIIDTTKLSNGVHTAGWLAYDSVNRGDGIGSRFFTVQNSGAGNAPANDEPIEPAQLDALKTDGRGGYQIDTEELERIELHVGAMTGHLVTGRRQRSLPIGSTLKGGTFYWQPGPGFLGSYDLEFQRPDGATTRVRVNIQPKRYDVQ